MRNISLRLLRQSGVYALGNVALKASGLVLAFFYLNPAYLTVEEFGYFGLLIVTAQLSIYLAGLGLGTGLLKFMTDPTYEGDHVALPFTALLATVGAALLALGGLGGLARPLAALMLDDAAHAVLVQLMALYMAFKVVGGIPLMLLRVQERAGWYIVAMIAEVLVLLGAAYFFLVEREKGLTGLIEAYALAAGVSATVLIGLMLHRVPWRFERRLVRVLIRYGAPLVIASLAGWFLNAGDRYLLKWLADATVLGLYEWAARLAGVLNMLFVQSFNLAFAVIGLKTLGEGGGDGQVHRRTLRHYVIWTGWAALGLALLAYDLTRLLPADPYYLQADTLILFLALGFMNYGIYYVIINVVYAAGHTKAISLIVLGAAILNGVLNLLLIPWLGALGAALATFLAYLVLALGAAHAARSEVQIGFPWSVFLIVVGLVGGLYALAQPSLSWSVAARLGTRLGLILAYPFLIILTGLYSREELRMLRDALKGWIRPSNGRRPG
ncbi:MAG: oligosaccharide flippase family protein [Rhodothermales bacterium]